MGDEAKNSPAPGSDIEQKLGIDQIQDAEKREVVKSYFEKTLTPEQRTALIQEKAKTDLKKLKGQIDSLNQRHASAEEFVQQIIETMQKENLERDLNTNVEGGAPHGDYIDYFMNLCGFGGGLDPLPGWEKYKDKGFAMDWDDLATFNYCIDKVKNVIRSIPPNVKKETRDQYAKEFMTAYAQAIDNFDSTFENFDMGEINEPEKKMMTEQPFLLSFSAWLTQKGMKLEDVTYQYSKLDTKTIVDTKARLEAVKKGLGAFPQTQQDYYNQQIKNIEGYALNNPAQAMEQLAGLEKDMAALTTFVAFKDELKALRDRYTDLKGKYSDFDTKFDGQISDLQKKYDDRSKQLDTEKDVQKRMSIMDVSTDLKKTKDQLDFDLTKAGEDNAKKKEETDKQAADAAAAAKPDENAPEEEKPGFMDQAVLGDSKLSKIVKDLGKIPLIGGFILSAFLAPSTLKALGIAAPKGLDDFFKANNTPKTPEQLKEIEAKAKALLKDHFKIETTSDIGKISEMDALSKTTVKDFFKKKPDNFDQKRYDTLVAELKKNGAKDTEDKKVYDFILLNVETWKS